jgi:hypothetical protein
LRALLWFFWLVAQLYHQRLKGASFHNTYETARYQLMVNRKSKLYRWSLGPGRDSW